MVPATGDSLLQFLRLEVHEAEEALGQAAARLLLEMSHDNDADPRKVLAQLGLARLPDQSQDNEVSGRACERRPLFGNASASSLSLVLASHHDVHAVCPVPVRLASAPDPVFSVTLSVSSQLLCRRLPDAKAPLFECLNLSPRALGKELQLRVGCRLHWRTALASLLARAVTVSLDAACGRRPAASVRVSARRQTCIDRSSAARTPAHTGAGAVSAQERPCV